MPRKDTQPFDGIPGRNNREYVPAEWAEVGEGGGAPKLAGGYEQSKTDGQIATRGLNRKDQRYQQDEATLIANRTARATAEYAGTLVLQGSAGLIELRSPSGNNYDLAMDASDCDCPDFYKIRQSGKAGVACKHIYIAAAKLAVVGGYANLDWSPSRLAEAIGIDERTAQKLCQEGIVVATKVHNNWVIPYDAAVQTAIDTYIAKMIMPGNMPEIVTG